MLILIVDFDDAKIAKKSHKAIEIAREVSPKYSHFIGFYYVNNTVFHNRKRMMGITWDELPAITFSMMDSRVMPYPQDRPITSKLLFDWLDSIAQGSEHRYAQGFQQTKWSTLRLEACFLIIL